MASDEGTAARATGALTVRLELPRLFHTELALHHVKTSSFGAPCRFEDGERVSRLFRLSAGPVVVRFSFRSGPEEPAKVLEVSLLGFADARPASAADHAVSSGMAAFVPGAGEKELRDLAASLWGLDDDLEACYAAYAGDPVLGPLVRRFSGLRLVRGPDLYETLLVAILGQQVSVASAQSIRRRLLATLGDRLETDGYLYTGYPPPDNLLAAGPDDLRALGLSRQKSRYVLSLAQWAKEGRLESARFASLDDAAVVGKLTEIPGVGRWTAEVALMRGLGRSDAFPAADLGLQVALQRALGLADRPNEKALREAAEHWKGWRSYAAFYLWMSLQVKGYA